MLVQGRSFGIVYWYVINKKQTQILIGRVMQRETGKGIAHEKESKSKVVKDRRSNAGCILIIDRHGHFPGPET